MKVLAASLAMIAASLGGCATTGDPPAVAASAKHPEARLYDASLDAKEAVDAAILKAEADNRLVLIALGANWCHDSRAFAGWTQEPRLKALITEHFELVFVNIGMPQTGDGHNLDIGKRFGLTVEGTPTVLVLSPTGELLNADSAAAWRNAASRSEDAIYTELAGFTGV